MLRITSMIVAILVITVNFSHAQKASKPVKVKLKNETDSVSYALGAELGNSIKRDGVDTLLNKDIFLKGILNGIMEKDGMSKETRSEVIQSFFSKVMEKQNAALKQRSEKFLADNKMKKGVKTTASGLQYEVLEEGNGPKPTQESTVSVHYTGYLMDGQVFDSSDNGDPVEFPLNMVIPGWTEGIQLMSIGSKFKFYIPADLAYGPQGQPQAGIGPHEVLIFEVELLDIK